MLTIFPCNACKLHGEILLQLRPQIYVYHISTRKYFFSQITINQKYVQTQISKHKMYKRQGIKPENPRQISWFSSKCWNLHSVADFSQSTLKRSRNTDMCTSCSPASSSLEPNYTLSNKSELIKATTKKTNLPSSPSTLSVFLPFVSICCGFLNRPLQKLYIYIKNNLWTNEQVAHQQVHFHR